MYDMCERTATSSQVSGVIKEYNPILAGRQRRIHMFLGLPDPDPLVIDTDPAPDPDPSIIKQK